MHQNLRAPCIARDPSRVVRRSRGSAVDFSTHSPLTASACGAGCGECGVVSHTQTLAPCAAHWWTYVMQPIARFGLSPEGSTERVPGRVSETDRVKPCPAHARHRESQHSRRCNQLESCDQAPAARRHRFDTVGQTAAHRTSTSFCVSPLAGAVQVGGGVTLHTRSVHPPNPYARPDAGAAGACAASAGSGVS